MECESAMAGSLEWKRSPHDFSEPEMWNAIGEAFRVDDLLDFSNDDIGAPIGDEEGNTSDSAEASESTERNYYEETHKNEEPLASELCVPTDALAELEWLSSFVEDSFSTVGLTELPPCYGGLIPSVNDNKDSKEDMKLNNQCQTSPFGTNRCKIGAEKLIPGRARSKRSRTGGRVWSFNSSRLGGPSFESQSPVFVSAFSVNDNSSDSSSSASFRPVKKPKGNHAKKTLEGSQPRRCSHCLVQKTPQWRAGPMGPKTLCNACGVRFKSGRLLPEYRPAMSPTFLSEVHSNSHRKVLEMRRQKEQQMTSENHGFVTSFTQEGVLV